MALFITHKKLKPFRIRVDTQGNYIVERRIKGKRQSDKEATETSEGWKKGDKYTTWKNEGYFSSDVVAFKKIADLQKLLIFGVESTKDVEVDADDYLQAIKEQRKKLLSLGLT